MRLGSKYFRNFTICKALTLAQSKGARQGQDVTTVAVLGLFVAGQNSAVVRVVIEGAARWMRACVFSFDRGFVILG